MAPLHLVAVVSSSRQFDWAAMTATTPNRSLYHPVLAVLSCLSKELLTHHLSSMDRLLKPKFSWNGSQVSDRLIHFISMKHDTWRYLYCQYIADMRMAWAHCINAMLWMNLGSALSNQSSVCCHGVSLLLIYGSHNCLLILLAPATGAGAADSLLCRSQSRSQPKGSR